MASWQEFQWWNARKNVSTSRDFPTRGLAALFRDILQNITADSLANCSTQSQSSQLDNVTAQSLDNLPHAQPCSIHISRANINNKSRYLAGQSLQVRLRNSILRRVGAQKLLSCLKTDRDRTFHWPRLGRLVIG